jgi:hypothetical protein
LSRATVAKEIARDGLARRGFFYRSEALLGEGAQTDAAAKQAPDGAQRVSCPSCGHLLFKVKTLEGADAATVGIEIKCKASRCGRFVEVTFQAGRLNLALSS